MSRFVAVVGTVNRDLIVTADGRTRESLGGILYNVMTLAALLDGTEVKVRAYGRLGDADRREAVRLLSGLAAADPGALVADPAGTNLSRLDYSVPGDRDEHVDMRVAPLTIEDLPGAEHAEAVLVNMISGRDVSRETLAEVRRRSLAPFLLDVQALARTLDAPRRSRRVPDWEDWCRLFDVVRGNEEEITHFAGGAGGVREAMRRVLRAGAGEVLVTRGAAGARRGTLAGGELRLAEVPPFPAGPVEDPTGCGDSFLSAVCAGRVLGLGGEDSVWLGSWVAARVARLPDLESLAGLRGSRRRAAREVERLRALDLTD